MSPTTEVPTASPALIAELNDLLQLDHDALQSYALTIRELDHPAYRETVRRYLGDHQRHVDELTALIERHGGLPLELPHPTGIAKLAKQALGGIGGDRRALLAFRANERQARDKYERAAERAADWPADVRATVRRGADDELRHYAWVDTTLESLGVTESSVRGRAARAMETVHARSADAVEAVGRQGMRGFEAARRGVRRVPVPRPVRERPLLTALAVVGTGLLIAAIVGRVGASRRPRRWSR